MLARNELVLFSVIRTIILIEIQSWILARVGYFLVTDYPP